MLKKRDLKKKAPSIMATQKGHCFLCGRWGYTEEHHIFGSKADRPYSEHFGLKVDLCISCHREGKKAVHNNAEENRKLQIIGQVRFEEVHKDLTFTDYFRKNYVGCNS